MKASCYSEGQHLLLALGSLMENTGGHTREHRSQCPPRATEDDSLECWKEMLERLLKILVSCFQFLYLCY